MNTLNILPPSFYVNEAQNEKIKGLEKNLSNKDKEDKELLKACNEFEAIFVGMMYKEMKKTIPDNPLMPKSNAEKIFEDMLLDEMAKENTEVSGLGLSKMLYEQFKKSRDNLVSPEELKNKQ